MLSRKGLRVALCTGVLWSGACGACDSKTPVPFKRVPPGAQAAQAATPEPSTPAAPIEPETTASVYPEGTQRVRVAQTLIERPQGTIRASLVHDLDGDGQDDVFVVTTDAEGNAQLEGVAHGASEPSLRLPLRPYESGQGCRAVAASVSTLGRELAVADVDFLCDVGTQDEPTAMLSGEAASTAPGRAPGSLTPAAPANEPTFDLAPPPEPPASVAQTHHFVVGLNLNSQVLLHLAGEPATGDAAPALSIVLQGTDLDGDGHTDVQGQLEIQTNGAEPLAINLTWLNRPSGLARERQQPEQTLAELGADALRMAQRRPGEASALSSRALELHRVLCRESGEAKLWLDGARGLPCGASQGAGMALAAQAIALARTQTLLPALQARDALSEPAYTLNKRTRARVDRAIAAIAGDTSFRWQTGPALAAPQSPKLRLPALGFIDENQLLLRGPIAQAYDLTTHVETPTGVPGSVVASDAHNQFALSDIVRGCDGYYLQLVAAGRIIGGVVTGSVASEPLLTRDPQVEASGCTAGGGKPSDHDGFTLLGWYAGGVLFARGAEVQEVPLDAQAHASAAPHSVGNAEPLPALAAPGALDGSGRHFALATSEGVAIVDRTQPNHARLVRPPASCGGGRVSDAALSPSGRKVAMLCGGRAYVAEPAAESSSDATQTSGLP